MIRSSLCAVILIATLAGCARPHSSLAPAKALVQGWECYDAALYDDAEHLFIEVARDTPDGDERHFQALYGQASTINLRRPNGDQERARPIYAHIVAGAPDSDWAAWSLLALARILALPPSGEAPKLGPLVAAYQKVIDQFPSRRAGEEAVLFQQSARVASFDVSEARQAAALLERFVVEHSGSVYLNQAYRVLSRAYENTNQPDKALAALLKYNETFKIDPRHPRSDYVGAYWSIARMANYRVGDFATARRYYHLLIDQYPTDKCIFTAKLALRQMDEQEARLRKATAVSEP